MIAGIDLGNSNMRIYYKGGKEYFPAYNLNGNGKTPSFVLFTDEKEIIVGDSAKCSFDCYKGRVIYGTRMLIGRRKGDEDIEDFLKNADFSIKFDKNEFPYIEIPGIHKQYKPEDISAIILREADKIIKEITGSHIDKCVITVPAYFNELQRKCTVQAAKLAGINCIQLINEPTAVAIASRYRNRFRNGNILIFDFGRKALDVSILNVEGDKYTVKAVACNTLLGGEDIDTLLAEEMARRFKKTNPGSNPEEKVRLMRLLKQKCEEGKILLSSRFEVQIHIPGFSEGKDLKEKISRGAFENLCSDITNQLTEPIDIALKEAELEKEDIDQVILIGKSTGIPFVRDTIIYYFDDRISPIETDSEESIALGAVIACDMISNKRIKISDSTFVEKTTVADYQSVTGEINTIETQPMSIGVKYGECSFKKIIISNKILPQSGMFKYIASKGSKNSVDIEIYQGEEDKINMEEKTHILLGKYTFSDLPPEPFEDIIITIELSVSFEGVLSVKAQCNVIGIDPIEETISTDEVLDNKANRASFERIKETKKRKDLLGQFNDYCNKLSRAILDAEDSEEDVDEFKQFYKSIKDADRLSSDDIIKATMRIDETIKKIEDL